MKVLVDARLESGRTGGHQQSVIALATALARSADQRDCVRYLTLDGLDGWLRERVASDQIVTSQETSVRRRARELRGSAAGRRVLRLAAETRNWMTRPPDRVETLDGHAADVVHFPTQNGAPTRAPYVYQPWDLQHRHLPNFFSRSERHRRDVIYRSLCDAAARVVIPTEWGKQDLIETYAIDAAKIVVVPPSASVLSLSPEATGDEIAEVRRMVGAHTYALFPAQAWPHKNHKILIDAVALLRGRGTEVTVVCSGATDQSAVERLERHARASVVGDLFVFPGYLPQALMRPLYEGARCVVFPSLFEGWGHPVVEAFDLGIPVVTSHRGSLREVAGNAAEICDPTSSESLADAIGRVWLDDDRRERLVVSGRARAAQLSWSSIGDAYRSIYRSVATGQPARPVKVPI